MQPRNIRFRVTLLAVALSLPSLAFAQSEDAKDLDNVVSTATRTAITADAALVAVEVIDRKDIERSSARSLLLPSIKRDHGARPCAGLRAFAANAEFAGLRRGELRAAYQNNADVTA